MGLPPTPCRVCFTPCDLNERQHGACRFAIRSQGVARMLALLSACSALRAAPGAARSVVPPRAVSPLMASWTADDMKFKRLKLPKEVSTHTAPR